MGQKLTKKDVEKIEQEIEHRKFEVRQKAIEDVKEARAQGDLSENFEYYAAKRFKNQNESRIRYLENVLKNAQIVEDTSSEGEVGLNDVITIFYEDDEEEETFKLVTPIRASSLDGRISIDSPIGKAIQKHKVGDTVTVHLDNGGSFEITIQEIQKSDSEDEDINSF